MEHCFVKVKNRISHKYNQRAGQCYVYSSLNGISFGQEGKMRERK
jgi:hypothetical protein